MVEVIAPMFTSLEMNKVLLHSEFIIRKVNRKSGSLNLGI